jgi:hypothetical protein
LKMRTLRGRRRLAALLRKESGFGDQDEGHGNQFPR